MPDIIPRKAKDTLRRLANQFKIVGIVGPRQSGKTTLTRYVFQEKPYVSLENPDNRQFALEDPRGFLEQYEGGAVFDEAQRVPDLFSWLQQMVDEDRRTGRFILTGSNNFLLQENISQSLAGRIAYIYLLPFSSAELPGEAFHDVDELLFKGLYPPIYDQPIEPVTWYANYIRTYVERDVRQIKNISNLQAFERFVRLCAGRTGQLLNMNSLAVETGIDAKTAASWIGVLESSFIVHRLRPHYKNFNKRVIKMPKLFFYDTGLVCALLGIRNSEQLAYHPLKGSLFENLIVNEMIKYRFNRSLMHNLFFWRNHTGNEIDVIIEHGDELYPVEIKSGKTITRDYFKGLSYWKKLTGRAGGAIIYAGHQYQRRSDGNQVVPFNELDKLSTVLAPE